MVSQKSISKFATETRRFVMAGKVKLQIDEVVLEYSSYVWDQLVGDDPRKIVYQLSSGKGIVTREDSTAHKKIELLMRYVSLFVPRVRLEQDLGYRSENAQWYAYLLRRKKALKCMPVYLADAVNQVIVKPYQDKILQLRESVKAELQAQKQDISLTAEQAARLDVVKSKINEQKRILRSLPRCTNNILTTLLHEYVDNLTQEDAARIETLSNEIANQEERLKAHKERLKEASGDSTSDRRFPLEKMVEGVKATIHRRKRQRYEIRKKYYEKFRKVMTPDVIANQLIKYPGTFWEQFNRNINIVETNVKLFTSEKSGKKSPRKQIPLAKRGESLLLFPHSFLDMKVDEVFLSEVDSDLKVYEKWDVWARENPEKSFTQSYKETYESYRNQFMTRPEIQKIGFIGEGPDKYEMNCIELMEYLERVTINDETGKKKVKAASDIIWKFYHLDNFEERFRQLRRMIDSGTVKFPGGFAVNEISKMLDPNYVPNIR